MKRTVMTIGLILALAAGPAAAQEAPKQPAAPKKEAAAPAKPAEKSKETAEAPSKPAEMSKEAAPSKPAEPRAAEKAAMSDAAVTLARLAVCEGVEDRAPVGEAESFQGVRKLYCFTRVEGAETPTRVYHRWYVGDRMVNEIPINVKGPRWRCWSEKTIQPSWQGACRVEVATEGGDILGTKTFTLAAADRAMKRDEAHEKAAAAKAEGQEKAAEAKKAADEKKAAGEKKEMGEDEAGSHEHEAGGHDGHAHGDGGHGDDD